MSAILPIGPAARIAGPYTATAGQTVFTFAFALLDAGDLTVETAPAAEPDNWTPATFGTEWTIPTALPTVAGGNIVFALGRAAGTRVRIVGAAVIANTQDPLPAGRVESGLLNRFFDRTTIWAQEARRDIGAALALLKTSANGWTPIEAVESYGERRVRKIVDWVGGIGAKPAVNRYVGAAGLTTNVAQAVDIRGAAGGGVRIIGTVAAVEDLPASGAAGDAWVVDENLYVWSAVSGSWTNLGPLMEGTLETANHIGLTSVDIDARNIPAPVVNLGTSGFSAPGDGGDAKWRSVGSEPAHPGKRPSLFGRWWELYNNVYTPQHFGVFDDPTLLVDQSARLQDWLDACAYTGRAPYVERPLQAVSEEKLYYQPGADMPGCVDMRRLSLHFALDGGLHIGEPGQTIVRSDLYTPKITRRGTLTWLAEERASRLSDNAGLVLYNCIGSHIRVSSVIGFTVGYAVHAEDGFFAYNTLDIGWLSDNRYAEVLRSMDAGGFVNENAFNGGNRTCYSGANLLGDAYGTVITAADGAYRGHNTNRFNTPCYEMNSPASATYRVPVLLDRAGVYNYWILPRHEGGKGPFGIADNGSGASTNAGCFNKVLFGYESSGAPGPTFYAGWKQVAGAYGNIAEHAINTPRPRFSSGPLARIAKSSGGNTPKIAAPYFMQTGTDPSTAVSPSRTGPSTGIRANSRCLNIVGGSNAVLIEVDTTKIKTWRLTGSFLDGKGGRPFIQAFGVPPAWNGGQTVLANTHRTNDGGKVYVCRTGGVTDAFGGPTGTGTNIADGAVVKWDYAGVLADFAQGAVLVGTVTDNWGTEQYVKSYLLPAVNAGGGYVAGSDTQTPVLFTVRDDVTKIRIGYVGGSATCALLGFELEGYPTPETNSGVTGATQSVAILDPLPTQSGSGAVVSANPASSGIHGFYGDGDMLSIAGAASGQPMGCKASIIGALAPARTTNTTYAVIGTLAVADTDKVYEIAVPGTTDAGAGPTGTGKGITDGTAVWNYVCQKAAFASLPNMP